MPKRKDLKKILVVGAGPIIIGQACEFDYSGTQACKALRDEGYKVVLINSNPATIMTDPDVADKTYIEPITLEVLEKILKKEKPDAILPTMGGQTALNLAMEAEKKGILKKYKIELIGANSKAISNAEDRKKFRKNMLDIGLDLPKSKIVNHNKIIGSKMYHSVSLQANKSSVDPTATTATYSGELLGSYSSIGAFHAVNGKPMITNADVSMTANFATDSIAFSTSNTVGKQLPSLGSNISLSSLDMTGTLTDPDNNNSFTGNVTTSGAHTGSVTALVIGDSAEELSGFGSTSTTNEIHSFGFITKK